VNEQRQPHIVVLFENYTNAIADSDVRRIAVNQIGRQSDTRTVIEAHDGDDVGYRESSRPCLMIDGVSFHGREAGDLARRQIAAQTFGTYGTGRMKPLSARVAAQNAQLPFAPCRPEERIERRQDG
jgi:hypothetical protein